MNALVQAVAQMPPSKLQTETDCQYTHIQTILSGENMI